MVSLEFWSQGFPYGTTHSPPSLAAFEKVFGSRTNIALHNCQFCATVIRHIPHSVRKCSGRIERPYPDSRRVLVNNMQ